MSISIMSRDTIVPLLTQVAKKTGITHTEIAKIISDEGIYYPQRHHVSNVLSKANATKRDYLIPHIARIVLGGEWKAAKMWQKVSD